MKIKSMEDHEVFVENRRTKECIHAVKFLCILMIFMFIVATMIFDEFFKPEHSCSEVCGTFFSNSTEAFLLFSRGRISKCVRHCMRQY